MRYYNEDTTILVRKGNLEKRVANADTVTSALALVSELNGWVRALERIDDPWLAES